MCDYSELKKLFAEHGQDHIFAGWDRLDAGQRELLLNDAASVDFSWLDARREEYLKSKTGTVAAIASRLEAAEVVALPKTEQEKANAEQARSAGEELIRQGKAAAFLVAGGQGTRLGFDGPKGCFPLGPVSGRTLFHWHGQQVLARSRRYSVSIPWYIMTSRLNSAATRTFFKQNDYFGLKQEDVVFFEQDMVPTVDFDGKLLMSSPCTLAMNPNGHGGAISGLYKSGAIDDMARRGVEYVCSFQVDNPLTTICDPLFIGYHALAKAEMSSKVLRKTEPEEKIGSVAMLDGRPVIVEYSDLDKEAMYAKNANGDLKFWAGSIGIHVMNAAFVKRLASEDKLPWHQAIKKVPYFDGEKMVKPEKPNGVKFETFIFDAVPFSAVSVNFEVMRSHEFAPVKNASGVDSAESSRKLLAGYFAEWLAAAGIAVPGGDTVPAIEISPLYSLDAQELQSKVRKDGVKVENALLLA